MTTGQSNQTRTEMNAGATWERFCRYLIDEPTLGFRLDVSRITFSDAALASLMPAMTSALGAMEKLESGAVANPDEQRQVGHYWLRKPELAPDDKLKQEVEETNQRIKAFAARIHTGEVHPPVEEGKERFKNLLIVGIGGSALGPQLIDDALAKADNPLTAYFIDNTDPDGIDRVLAEIGDGLSETLILIISKSGGTKETRNGMIEVREALIKKGLKLGPRAVAITGAGSQLDQYARDEGFLDIFPMWDWVGGRTSVTSAVGLLPAALQGFDIDLLLEGGRLMDELTRKVDPLTNPATMMAAMWHIKGNGCGERDLVVLPYKDRLLLFARYLQQLVMESLGKELDLDGKPVNQGLVVYGNKGSTDQHAYVQQLREGPDNFFMTFIEVLKDRAGDSIPVDVGVTTGDYLLGFLLGTREALSEKGHDSMQITINEVSELTLGALIALFERTVGIYASMVNINAYHQPGVEAGKKAAGVVLELQQCVLALLADNDGKGLSAEEIAGKLNCETQIETVFHITEHLVANGRLQAKRSDKVWNSVYSIK